LLANSWPARCGANCFLIPQPDRLRPLLRGRLRFPRGPLTLEEGVADQAAEDDQHEHAGDCGECQADDRGRFSVAGTVDNVVVVESSRHEAVPDGWPATATFYAGPFAESTPPSTLHCSVVANRSPHFLQMLIRRIPSRLLCVW
jgi:hypothetical protein